MTVNDFFSILNKMYAFSVKHCVSKDLAVQLKNDFKAAFIFKSRLTHQ